MIGISTARLALRAEPYTAKAAASQHPVAAAMQVDRFEESQRGKVRPHRLYADHPEVSHSLTRHFMHYLVSQRVRLTCKMLKCMVVNRFQYTEGADLGSVSGNPLAETVSQIYGAGVGYVLWNDQPLSKSPHTRVIPQLHAHAKGLPKSLAAVSRPGVLMQLTGSGKASGNHALDSQHSSILPVPNPQVFWDSKTTAGFTSSTAPPTSQTILPPATTKVCFASLSISKQSGALMSSHDSRPPAVTDSGVVCIRIFP